MAERRAGEFRGGKVFSVRLDAETASELDWAASESGRSASRLFREGLRPVLAWIRAEWYEKHGSDAGDWGEPAPATPGPARRLGASFGVRLEGDEIAEVAQAANACGVSISAFMRQATLALIDAQRAGGTARCGHISISGVAGAACSICGPLSVTLAVSQPA